MYFKRGHGQYFAYAIGLASFLVIQYRLLIDYVPFLQQFFQSMLVFALTFTPAYLCTATIVGWLDFKRIKTPSLEDVVRASVNPYTRSMLDAAILSTEGMIALSLGNTQVARAKFEGSNAIKKRWRDLFDKAQRV